MKNWGCIFRYSVTWSARPPGMVSNTIGAGEHSTRNLEHGLLPARQGWMYGTNVLGPYESSRPLQGYILGKLPWLGWVSTCEKKICRGLWKREYLHQLIGKNALKTHPVAFRYAGMKNAEIRIRFWLKNGSGALFMIFYWMNILYDFKSLFLSFHTFGVRRPLYALDPQIRPGFLILGHLLNQKYENKKEALLSKICMQYDFKNLSSSEVRSPGSDFWQKPDPHWKIWCQRCGGGELMHNIYPCPSLISDPLNEL